jgi:hypothetical protein
MNDRMAHNWNDEDTYWRSNYSTRPYASGSTNYDQWRGAYRYGFESANRYSGKNWNDVESDLSRGWNSYEHRGSSTWEQVKAAVRDGWERVTGRHTVGSR